MLVLFNVFKLLLINVAIASELNCSALFDTGLSINDKISNHIFKVDKLIHGTPHQDPYFIINNNLQFRYFDVDGTLELKLLGKFELGEVSKAELDIIKNRFYPQMLKVQKIKNNKYVVNRWVVLNNVPQDFNSGLIKADGTYVRSILDQFISSISLTRNPHHKAILFLDVDNLGLVNYFPGGHTTGDAYIKAVIEVVTENLRSEDGERTGDKDIGFKNYNGDEFFYLLDNVSEGEIAKISKRIEGALKNDPRINLIKIKANIEYDAFKKYLKSLGDYSQLEQVQGLNEYIQSSKTWKKLNPEEKINIKSNPSIFQKFMSSYLKSTEVIAITNSLNNISLGGSFGIELIKTGDTLDSALNRACLIMEKCKILKKSNQKKFAKENIYFPEL